MNIADKAKEYRDGLIATGVFFAVSLASRKNEILQDAVRKSAVDTVRDTGKLPLYWNIATRLAGVRADIEGSLQAARWNNEVKQGLNQKGL